MEKLIELLNEYEYSLFEDKSLATQRWDIQDWIVFEKDFCEDIDKPRDLTMDITHLISHRFWFIKWLVENDKIETEKVWEIWFIWKYDFETNYYLVDEDNVYDKCETLLMLLAIQDEPIRFLCEILK